MQKKLVEVMFWNEEEAILIGTQSKFTFGTMQEAKSFVKGFKCDNCTQVTFKTFHGKKLTDEESYNVSID